MRRLLPAASLLALAFALPAAADEKDLTLDDQTGVNVTIYNQDLALVRDLRSVDLVKGENDIAFIDVSAQIRPQTALIKAPGARIDVLEQNFDFDLLTPEKLLEKSVGSMVRVITVDPESGDETVQDAKVLSVANGVVLQIGDRIETQPPGRIVFSEVPPNLRSRPTLVTKLSSDVEGKQPVELDYLTGGLGWSADYVAELTPDESRIDLKGWVTLTNTSGTSYRNAKLQLVAGEVHQVTEEINAQMRVMTTGEAAPAAAMQEQPMFEYHLYTLARPTTIAENQTKQVELLSAQSIPVNKEYRFTNVANFYNEEAGEPQRVNADVRLHFDNREDSGLGIPLPKGIVRVYKADADGQTIFVGEDSIKHTPKNESVDLMLGQAFDITARGRQTDFNKISDQVYESSYEIDFKNAKTDPVSVTLAESMPGDWRILEESATHDKPDSATASWKIAIPAEGSAKLTYSVRVTY